MMRMNAKAFLDTNVLVYATVTDDPRAAIAMALLEQGGTISVQVLNEFTNTAIRKLKRSWSDVTAALAAFRLLLPSLLPITVAMHEAALEMAQRDRVSFYDALIVAAALEAGCSTLLSEDMQHGRVIDGRLTIQNPFAQVLRERDR
jgi:predicted nucleic acid-binding protein